MPLATALGLTVDPELGLFVGFPLVFVGMLFGLSYWGERFAGDRWLTRVARTVVRPGAQDYRGARAVSLLADGRPAVAKRVYLNAAESPGPDGRGLHVVLLDTDRGLMEIDTFDREPAAAQLADDLGARLGVDQQRVAAGPSDGSESTFDGLLTWCGVAAPVMAFLPLLLVVPSPAWVPSLAGLLFVLASLLLEVRVRTSASTTAEMQFRERLRSRPARSVEVRVEAPRAPLEEPAESAGRAARAVRER